jgi:molecular chaperone DnaK
MSSVIGIDLGTTFSLVATIDETGRPKVVPNSTGSLITPSCVVQTSPGVMEVGEYARRQWGNAPETAAARFKRDMGSSNLYTISGATFTPTDLSALVLKKLFADAKDRLGSIHEAVVTIPANFSHEAREATMSAAKIAGLNVRFIINEPTAAALYYAFKRGTELSGIYAVYDLGGGTFDISIIRVNGQSVEVLATGGIGKLGGDDFDSAIQKIVQNKFKEVTKRDLEVNEFTKNDAEEEKKSLSSRKQVTVRVAKQLIDIKRDEFEEAISTLIAQAEMLSEATIDEASISLDKINEVFLVGGSTRIPSVIDSVRRIFKREPITTDNVDEVVALGAAIYAAYKSEDNVLTPVQKSAVGKITVSETTSKCFGTISRSFNNVRNEHTMVNNILIRKGDKIPCQITNSFWTVRQNQTAVNCTVTESVAPETDPRFVKTIWEGELSLPEGRPPDQEIKITFSYDENQIMKCSFVDVETKAETKIDLSMTSGSQNQKSRIDKFTVE